MLPRMRGGSQKGSDFIFAATPAERAGLGDGLTVGESIWYEWEGTLIPDGNFVRAGVPTEPAFEQPVAHVVAEVGLLGIRRALASADLATGNHTPIIPKNRG